MTIDQFERIAPILKKDGYLDALQTYSDWHRRYPDQLPHCVQGQASHLGRRLCTPESVIVFNKVVDLLRCSDSVLADLMEEILTSKFFEPNTRIIRYRGESGGRHGPYRSDAKCAILRGMFLDPETKEHPMIKHLIEIALPIIRNVEIGENGGIRVMI